MSSFVLVFADEAAQVAGIAWSLAGREGALLSVEGTLSGPAASATVNGEGVRAQGSVGDREFAVEASGAAEHDLVAEPSPSGSPGASLGKAELRLSGAGGDEIVTCASSLTTWQADPSDGADLIRHVSFPVAGDGAILLIASRPAGEADHSAELVSAWQLDPGKGPSPFVESLLSTQYDAEGLPTRAGLELWSDDPDAPATRAAGSRPVTATMEGVTAALMHTSAEGTAGAGGYLIVRP